MSATAAAPSFTPKLTAGYATIPNSLIENQSRLTHAELALALIVLRRGGQVEPKPVSDSNWQNWTGLSPRLKEYAISGLKSKGLQVEGRGESARFGWRRQAWESYVRTAEQSRPRTAGRIKSQPAPKGARMHPTCAGTGCAMLHNAQPVAQTPAKPPSRSNTLTLLPASSLAQPVAQTLAEVWAQTLGAVQALFPLAGVAFLVRLIAVVSALFRDVNDEEVAAAVRLAYSQKRAQQKSEGLFLFTVPEAIAALRKVPKQTAPPIENCAGRAEGLLLRVLGAVRARGVPFAKHAAALEQLAAEVQRGGPELTIERVEALEAAMQAQSIAITETAIDTLPAAESSAISDHVETVLAPYRAKLMSVDQARDLREKLTIARVFEVLEIPRLGLFFS